MSATEGTVMSKSSASNWSQIKGHRVHGGQHVVGPATGASEGLSTSNERDHGS